ncbi:MAG: porin family protein [Planctomycetota bacterium]|jgi:hypothetical protein
MKRSWFGAILVLALMALPAWAETAGNAAGEQVSDEIDGYLDDRNVADAASFLTPAPDHHAMFWGQDPDRLIIMAGVWWGKLSGPIKFDGGTVLDVSDAFGLKERVAVPFARAGLRWKFVELIVEGWWYDNDGRTIVEESFEIDGVVFEIGDTVDSNVKFSAYRAALGFTVLRRDFVTITILAGLTLIDTSGTVTALNAQKTAKWNETLPIPALGLSLKGEIKHPWIYEFEFNWIGYDDDAFDVRAVDIRGAIGYMFNDWIAVRGGYRYMELRGRIEAIGMQVELEGFYIEGLITF